MGVKCRSASSSSVRERFNDDDGVLEGEVDIMAVIQGGTGNNGGQW